MKRTPFIAGNWKMHNTIAESKALAQAIKDGAKNKNNANILLAPSYTALSAVAEVIKGSNILLAAQDLCWEDKGAFTSAVSGPQIKDAGCTHVIIGHSERRSVFGDTDEILNKKTAAALKHNLVPVFCVGETLAEREEGKTMDIIKTQLDGGLKGFSEEQLSTLVIAYEPVWAIGTGKTATPEQAQEVHAEIRKYFEKYSKEFSEKIIILYGGSVKTDNVDAIMAGPDVDGALVGGQSLVAEQFNRIIDFN